MHNNEQVEQLVENVIIPETLMNLITPPNNVDYAKWAELPLAEKFEDSADWINDIVPSLFSDNDRDKLIAMCKCHKLLEKISSEEKSISKKYNNLQPFKWVNRVTPLISVGSQILWSCYGPGETVCTALIAYLCTQSDQKLSAKSRTYEQHKNQLAGIANHVTNIVSQINNQETKKQVQKIDALNNLILNKEKLKLLISLEQQIREEIKKLKQYEPLQQDDD